jgi:hypothetical protein
MERRGILLVVALAMPLALDGFPYAYASIATSDHVVRATWTVHAGNGDFNPACHPGDYAVSGGYAPSGLTVSTPGGVAPTPEIVSTFPTLAGVPASDGQTPDGWTFEAGNASGADAPAEVWVVCQTP